MMTQSRITIGVNIHRGRWGNGQHT